MTVAQETGDSARSGLPGRVGPQAAVVLVGAMSLAWHGAIPLNHDAAWIWEGAARLLDGARFGRDIVDVNPPLAWWLTIVPVFLSRVTGLTASVSFSAFTVGIGAVCLLVALRMVSRRLSAASVWVFGSIGAWAVFFLPGYDFGQREHLMAALALPYLCAAGLRAERHAPPGGSAWLAGILGGVGFCLKPYFLFIPLFVEIWLWRRTRRVDVLRAEPVAMALVGVVYLTAVFLFARDYLDRVVPDAAVGYGAYGAPLDIVALRLFASLVPLLIGAGLSLVARPQGMQSALAQCLLVSVAGAAAAYLIQSKGWNYQMLPAFVFTSLAAAAAFPADRRENRLPAIAGLAIVVLLGAKGAIAQFADADGTRARVSELSEILKTSANGKAFAFVTSPRDIHPAIVESDTAWVARACCLHLLPASVAAARAPQAPGARAAIVAGTRQVQQTISLLVESAPGVIAVDDSPGKLGFGTRRFDYLRYFLRDARFARLWRGYREARPIGNFRIFRCVRSSDGKCSFAGAQRAAATAKFGAETSSAFRDKRSSK